MPRGKRSYSPEFKRDIVLEALKDEKSHQEIAVEQGIDPQLIGTWVRQAREQMSQLFTRKSKTSEKARDKELQQLHATIGELTVENQFLKKAYGKWK